MTGRIYVTFCSYKFVFLFTLASVLTSIQGHLLEFAIEPADTVVQPGNSAVLDCVVKSDSAPDALNTQWLDQDRQMLTFIGDSYRSQLTNGSLYISSVSEDLGLTGNYQCKASNGVESIVSRTANLSLASLSGFLEEPRDITVYPRQKAYFACRVQASPSPRIRWLKDERPLQLDELRMTILPSGALEIDEVTESDQGIYRCNASGLNSYRLSNKAVLIINGDREQALSISRPYFIALPHSEVVIEGQNVTLDCAANGNPNPTITWLKDGHNIDMNDLDSRFSLVGSTTSLKITNIQKEDAGAYQCRAENREDSDDATATMHVFVPPKFLRKPSDKVEFANKDVELECSVYGIPEPKVTWLKNGEVINLSEYYQLIKGNNLKIMGLMASDTGIFQCVASNAAGNIQASASLKVVDKEKPRNRVHKQNRKKKLNPNYQRPDEAPPPFGETQSRTLFTQLKPESSAKLGDVNYGHLQNFNPLFHNAPGNFDPHSIFSSLRSSEANDSSLGDTLTAYTESSPFSKPIAAEDYSETRSMDALPGPPQDLKAILAEPRFVVLSWKPPVVTNEDIVAYSVYYRQENNERERVQNTTRARLEEISIRNLRPACVYHFRVVAYNSYGPGVSSKSLTVTTKAEEHIPSQPLELSAYATSSHSIHVSWQPPEIPNGHVRNYVVYYTETLTSAEHKVNTTNLDFDVMGLTVFTEYSIWVVAVNDRGPGAASEEKLVRTFSAAPTAPPSNVTLEPSSTSITVRWEPPLIEGQNGIITGYKIRYRKQGNKGETITTPANNRVSYINDLDRGASYQFKLWAINVNGSGPSTDWYEMETYENDMDESRVPDQPSGLQVRPTTDKIYVMWKPPRDQKVKIRHYVLGWGKGIPDMYSHELDDKTRNYIINHLEPNSEYVLSVRASNQMGSGLPAYTTVRTSEEPPPEPITPLVPPVGLKVQILSPTSAVLYWTDSALSKIQYVSDNRHYVVQYTAEKSTRIKQISIQDLNIMIDDLKPNTQYEFMVKVVKGKRESPWSMVVTNKTWELALNTAPRELRVNLAKDNPQIIELEWQPPKVQNGHITGYVILYTTDTSKKDREWSAQAVNGDKHTFLLHDLEPTSTYFFKIQARNSRGYGPFSSVVSFRTGENFGLGSADNRQQKDGRGVFTGTTLLYLIVGGCFVAVSTIAVVVGVLCCRRQEATASPDRSKKGYQKGNQSIKPPDLWIHHDQMELKALEKSHLNNDGASSSGAMTLPRSTGANDFDPHENHHHTNSLDKRTYAPNSYMSIATATPLNSTSLSQTSSDSTPSSRPPYTRAQYTTSRAHVTLDQNAMANQLSESPYATHMPQAYDHTSGSQGYVSQPPPVAHVPPSYAPGLSVLAESQAGKRGTGQGHPLKSFTVPAPPPISAPGTPQPKHVVTQPQLTVRPSSSPYKKPPSSSSSNLTNTPPSRISGTNPPPHTAEEVQKLQPSHSTEELNQEMANLEGLMMTLNAITANEFEC